MFKLANKPVGLGLIKGILFPREKVCAINAGQYFPKYSAPFKSCILKNFIFKIFQNFPNIKKNLFKILQM